MQFNLHLIEKIIPLVEDLHFTLNRYVKPASILTKTKKQLS